MSGGQPELPRRSGAAFRAVPAPPSARGARAPRSRAFGRPAQGGEAIEEVR